MFLYSLFKKLKKAKEPPPSEAPKTVVTIQVSKPKTHYGASNYQGYTMQFFSNEIDLADYIDYVALKYALAEKLTSFVTEEASDSDSDSEYRQPYFDNYLWFLEAKRNKSYI